MRVQFAVVLAALAIAAAPAAAQNSAAVAGNVASSAPAQKSDSAKSRKATKPEGEKVCKRLSQGKVCMTTEQWKAYQEQF